MAVFTGGAGSTAGVGLTVTLTSFLSDTRRRLTGRVETDLTGLLLSSIDCLFNKGTKIIIRSVTESDLVNETYASHVSYHPQSI